MEGRIEEARHARPVDHQRPAEFEVVLAAEPHRQVSLGSWQAPHEDVRAVVDHHDGIQLWEGHARLDVV
ncbi:hypothetical protein [Streptacidiphilus carbonis]|uniref:hypothetical protein n=1 Tax=Streptacidiphilus carbonis TaxID=105422 RepID=UPI00137750F6|nr:hypothetical protein [Streptacidiphilus carbonis]